MTGEIRSPLEDIYGLRQSSSSFWYPSLPLAMSTRSQSPLSPLDDNDSAHPDRPQPRPSRSNFDLEPNPFEQSFARPPNHTSSIRSSQAASPVRKGSAHSDTKPSIDDLQHPRSPTSSSPSRRQSDRSASPKTVLPPLASISSPTDQYSWGFSPSSISNSLRAGPLSPAMLAGPRHDNGPSDQPPIAFDPTSFRSGLTPRTGLTPGTGTGLTPLMGGPVSFPPPSPNTAAFLHMMNNSTSGGATITPNTLNAITGVLSSAAAGQANGVHGPSPHPLSISHVPPSSYDRTMNGSHYTNGNSANSHSPTQAQRDQQSYAMSTAADAANSAANGLFLLSQAHQELTKREEAQRAGQNGVSTNGAANGKRGTKRKSYDVSSPTDSLPPSSKQPSQKRNRAASTNGRNGRRGTSPSINDEDDEEEEEEDMMDMQPPNGKKNGNKKPETEEEKRKNFLERNRQAALKCRQRKKAWLSQLQAKVEFLSTENERLQSALVTSREEIARLTAAAAAAANGMLAPVGVGIPPPQPVSVNVSLPPGTVKGVHGRGYGY